MNWLKLVFLAGIFITSYALPNNLNPTGNHVTSPWTMSNQIRSKRSVEFLNTGNNRWEAHVNLPPIVTNWMSQPQNANYVRDITQSKQRTRGSRSRRSRDRGSRSRSRTRTPASSYRRGARSRNRSRSRSRMSARRDSRLVRRHFNKLQDGIRLGAIEITGSGRGNDWLLESRPVDSPRSTTQAPTVEPRNPYVQPTNYDEESHEETEGDYGKSADDEFMPCKYGTSENPFPVPNIIKTGRRVSDIKCEEHKWHMKYRIIDAKENKRQCMIHKSITQVIGGISSRQGEYPHMGAVGWLANNKEIVFLCGTTLISPRFSLTAGHCRRLSSTYQNGMDVIPKIVRFGAVEINNINDWDLIDMTIDTIIAPPEFLAKPHQKYYDLGLIRFTEEVPLSENVRPACIWTGALDGLSTGVITGWGGTKENSLSSRLQYAEVDFIDKDVCQYTMNPRRNRLWRQGIVDHQFCAGKMTGGVDTCGGDSGGPIQISQPLPMDSSASMYYVVGITNFGIKCAEPNLPGVYTNVSHFLCWIEKTVWNKEENSQCP